MIAIALIGIAAGCASALMFASMISGVLISILLIYLAPLPLMVAALGWGPLCATIGGIAAATVLGAIFGLPYCIVFVVTVALLANVPLAIPEPVGAVKVTCTPCTGLLNASSKVTLNGVPNAVPTVADCPVVGLAVI